MNTEPELSSNPASADPSQAGKRKLTLRRSEGVELRERLQKVLAASGFGGRRSLEDRIAAGEVLLNGTKAEVGASVCAGDRVLLDERTFIIRSQEGDYGRMLVYSKPDGEILTRSDVEGRATVFERLPPVRSGRWIPIGDLDINTQGLLLFTSNGDLANKLQQAEGDFEREYVCRVKGGVHEEAQAALLGGMEVESGHRAFEEVVKMEHTGNINEWWRVRIAKGGGKDVRALWEALGFQLSRLKRISYGPFRLLPGMRRGDVRELPDDEVQQICQDFGIEQMPAYLIAEDEGAMRLRRNRDEVTKKKLIQVGKAEGYWTGERGYGGANVKTPQRVDGDVDRNARDKKAKRKTVKLTKKQAQIAIGSDQLLSHALEGGARPDDRNKRKKKRKGPRVPGGVPQANPNANASEVIDPNAPRKKGHRGGQRQRFKRANIELASFSPDAALDAAVVSEAPDSARERVRQTAGDVPGQQTPNNQPRQENAGRNKGDRQAKRTRPPRDPSQNPGSRADRPEIGNRLAGPNPRRDRQAGGEMVAEDGLGNSLQVIPSAPPGREKRFGGKVRKAPKAFSGPMDHAYGSAPNFHDDGNSNIDDFAGNRVSGNRDDAQPREHQSADFVGNRFQRDANRAPGESRGPRHKRRRNGPRPPQDPGSSPEQAVAGGDAGANPTPRPERGPRPPRRERGPRPPQVEGGERSEVASVDGAPRPDRPDRPEGERKNRRRRFRRRGPKPQGGATSGESAGAPPSSAPPSNAE